MIVSSITANLFLGLVVLTSAILIVIIIYLLIRFVNRPKRKVNLRQDFEPRLLDPESSRESRLSHRLSRQQTQREQREDLLQHYSSVSRPPSIELLPKIKTSSSDDRASEWLEQGVSDKGFDVVEGDLGEKKHEMRQVAVMKPKKHLRWECTDENMDGCDRVPGVAEDTKGDRTACTEYQSEKALDVAV
ncbi:hypothetical protein COCSADRAFT_359607 [Bipolaris sorokiniana ND90Pr]|uniref:Uncharacterized protein n=1 Tax=Cochliobolus sativus (strain ND90Pr / ATCC 201652) TaxID=665912 RepID=M2SLX0_COCSN|nr:uncharacterized protein COCSADRAFT_359607 [Bipolaris sorokiniana ND90Pr]EMD63295.1 hypothetical protein COCSADRAFT_359607 [Bipolaris sorokiniana ND90Pr]